MFYSIYYTFLYSFKCSLKQKINFKSFFLLDCELDIVFIVERYNLRYTKKFLVELMDNISVSSDGIRVGMVLFDSRASTVFTLDAYNSSESVRSAIKSISETNQIYHLVDKGLIEARDNVFTAARGDRMNASNYYVFIVGPFESYPEAVANDIKSNGSNFIFAIRKLLYTIFEEP